jgi:hypothetical protein
VGVCYGCNQQSTGKTQFLAPRCCSERCADAGAGLGEWRRSCVLRVLHVRCMCKHRVGGKQIQKNIIQYVLDAHDWNNQVFVAASGQHYEVIVEYKGTKASGAPMAAAAAGWGSSNVYARLARDFMMCVQRRVVHAPQV